jgi:hypothetical protein
MKKALLFITLALISEISHSNEGLVHLTFDKTKKQIVKIDKKFYNPSDGIQIVVNGIHPILHKVSINFDDAYWHSEPPKITKSVLPNISTLSFSQNAEIFKSESSIPEIKLIGYQRINRIISILDSAKTTLSKSYKSPNWEPSNDVSICLSIFNQISQLYPNGSSLMNNIRIEIASLSTTYDQLSKVKTIEDAEMFNSIIDYLSLNSWNNSRLKSSKSTILGVLPALKKGMKDSLTKSKKYYPKGEFTTVTIHIIDRFKPSDTITTFIQDIYKVGKFKIDFSSGIGVNSILDPSFYIGKNDTIPFIAEEEKRDIDFNIFGLAHFNWRVLSWLSLGPTTGVSISVFSAKPTYLVGGSISIGRKNLISLSGGISFGAKNILSRKVSSDGFNADLPLALDISTVPTYKKITKGYFISLTYNFKRVRKSIK